MGKEKSKESQSFKMEASKKKPFDKKKWRENKYSNKVKRRNKFTLVFLSMLEHKSIFLK
jgi:hypothetical protein